MRPSLGEVAIGRRPQVPPPRQPRYTDDSIEAISRSEPEARAAAISRSISLCVIVTGIQRGQDVEPFVGGPITTGAARPIQRKQPLAGDAWLPQRSGIMSKRVHLRGERQ